MYDYEKFARVLASIEIPRSKFNYKCPVKTTFNHGQIIPLIYEEVLPGDTWNLKNFSMVLRLSSPLKTPILDNITASVFIFFVPMRLLWSHWKQFMFENTESKWVSSTEYTIPMITAPDGGWNSCSLADYLGVRPGVKTKVNQLRFRCYCEIYNEWFRDQNLIDPVYYDNGDSDIVGNNGTDYVNDVVRGSVVMSISRHRDYISSCLPGPQKGPDVLLPLGDVTMDDIPVLPKANVSHLVGKELIDGVDTLRAASTVGSGYVQMPDGNLIVNSGNVIGTSVASSGAYNLIPDNLVAFGTSQFTSNVTINQLRTAFQLQKFYERLALGGSRYTEVIRSFFNVQSSDARLQRPEFLAGDRFPVNINQVLDTTSSNLAKVGAYSMTFGSGCEFIKSFEEHGILMAVIATQHSHSYQQGNDRFLYKETFTDFFFPVFNNLGEQPVYNREVYVQGTSDDSKVFGYQENYPEYRQGKSRITGQFRSGANGLPGQGLDTWHLADYYSSLPILSKEFIEESPITLDRVLTVSHDLSNQYLLDCVFDFDVSRPMSEYGVPGLIDHH